MSSSLRAGPARRCSRTLARGALVRALGVEVRYTIAMKYPVLLLALALAACDQPAEQPTAAPAATAQPNAFNERLQTMHESLRRATLMRAIIDSGQICRRVIEAEYRGPFQNLEMWTAQCEKAGRWGVFIGNDASVQVRACGELVQLGLPPCDGTASSK
jgi:hypothetical protein